MAKCKLSTKVLPATCAWLLLLGCTGLFFVFTYVRCPFLIIEYSVVIAIYQSLLTIFVISNFGFSTFMDPGVYPKASNELVKDGDLPVPLHKTVEINNVTVRMKWCTTCKFYRPPRSSHCSMCDCCIEVFDHHCPWVNNCVGRRNYKYFFQFLISLSAHMISIFCLSLLYVLKHKSELKTTENIVSMCLMGVIGLLSVPIIGLTCFHVVLIGRGRTTNEQVTGKMRDMENPFNRGCLKNCCYLLCGPTWPSLLRKSKWTTGSKAVSLSSAAYNASDSVVKIYMETSDVQFKNNKEYNKMSQTKQPYDQLYSNKPQLSNQQYHQYQPNSPPIDINRYNNKNISSSSEQQLIYRPPSNAAYTMNGGYNYLMSPNNNINKFSSAVVHQQQNFLQQQQQQHQQNFNQQQQQQQMKPTQPQLLASDMKYPTNSHPPPHHPAQFQQQQQFIKTKSPALPTRMSTKTHAGSSNYHRSNYSTDDDVVSPTINSTDQLPTHSSLHLHNHPASSRHVYPITSLATSSVISSSRPKTVNNDRQQISAGYIDKRRGTLDRKNSDIAEYKV